MIEKFIIWQTVAHTIISGGSFNQNLGRYLSINQLFPNFFTQAYNHF